MKIQEEDFILTSVDSSSYFFDLELLVEVNKKNVGLVKEFKNVGYGLALPHALRVIAKYRSLDSDRPVTLEEYITRYEKAANSLLKVRVTGK